MKNTEIVKEQKRSKLLAVAALTALAAVGANAADSNTTSATANQAFGGLYKTFSTFMSNNLGKTLSLLGFIGTVIIYMMTHRGSILFVGIMISIMAGAAVPLANYFFDIGKTISN